tara:strand:+ start:2504 stop:3277 length:774 start_codon:yes stop_codon:yes gene_type:complete
MSITVDYFRNQPPKKHRGQNFMINDANLDFLSRIINRKKSNWLIEIGGGLGFLTEKISNKNNLTVYEVDEHLNSFLKNKFPSLNIEGDVRNWQPEDAENDGMLVGNLPYYLSGRILWMVARWPGKIKNAVFTVQKEVADRICSKPGSKSYGLLSGPLQFFYSCKIEKKLSKNSFFPKPKVDSAIITLTNKNKRGCFPYSDQYLKLNKKIFSQRRKNAKKLLKKIVPSAMLEKIPDGFRPEDIEPKLGMLLSKNSNIK